MKNELYKVNDIKVDDIIKVSDFRVRLSYDIITQMPIVEVMFTVTDSHMDMQAGRFDELKLEYYGMIINLKGCVVKRQGAFSGGGVDNGPQPWKLRCYEINLDNKAEKECIVSMAKEIESNDK